MGKKTVIVLYISLGIIIASCVFLLSFVYGSYKKNSKKNVSSNNLYSTQSNRINTIQTVSKQEKKVNPSAKIKMTQYYQKCGHIVNEVYKVPSAIINMSEEEVKKYYNGWDLVDFNEKEISLYKSNESICGEHFVLRDVDGYVNVFVQTKDGDETLYKATDIMTKYLSEEDRECLKNGVKVVRKEDLAIILQDYQ